MHKFSFRFMTALTVLFALYTGAAAQSKGFDTSRMNTSIEACTDFFEYANGTWLKNTEIPASESRWGTFNILADNNNAILREILENAAKTGGADGSDSQLIGDFYSSCMNETAIEKAGAKPLKPYFKQIKKIKTVEDLTRQIAMMHQSGLPALFGFGGGTDLKNSSMVIVNTSQGGLSLQNRNYYLDQDAKTIETRQKFVEYMTNMFKLLGDNPAEAAANAKTVMDIQTRLAKASLSPVDLRNPDKRYNKMTLAAAQEITPNFSWASYMTTRGVPAVMEINVGQPDFFREMNLMIKEVSIDDWKTYLRWMTINATAPALSKKFADENFNFYGRYLERRERTTAALENLRQRDRQHARRSARHGIRQKNLHARRAKARMDELIDNLFVAMKERIGKLEWMSEETKTQA